MNKFFMNKLRWSIAQTLVLLSLFWLRHFVFHHKHHAALKSHKQTGKLS
jgi:hypothetical protein